MVGLLATIVLLSGFQAQTIVRQPGFMAAILLLVQSYGTFALAYAWAWVWWVPFAAAAPAALIGTSNFFSGAALATVVPVMLSLVGLAHRTCQFFPSTV
jgi:ACR3 family arsenite transporter